MKTLVALFSVIALSSLAACFLALPAIAEDWPPAPPANCNFSDGLVYAAWTQITGNGSNQTTGAEPYPLRGVVRVIVSDETAEGQELCDTLRVGYDTQSGVSQRYADGFTARTSPGSNFPVTVCEIDADPAWTRSSLYRETSFGADAVALCLPNGTAPAAQLPTLYSVGRRNDGELRLTTTADTGCRDCTDAASCGKNEQACSETSWPYRDVVNSMANQSPDLILHAGDYRYRDQRSSDSEDSWSDWYKDFFYPSMSGLQSSPWVMARGNHEECSGKKDAGPGWFYFLDQKDAADQRSCDDPGDDRTWHFDVAIKTLSGGSWTASAPHRFGVLDTSDKDADTPSDFQTLEEWAMEADDTAWWVMHRPVWGISTDTSTSDDPTGVKTRTGSLQKDLKKAVGDKSSPQTDCSPTSEGGSNGWLKGKWKYDQVTCHLRTILAGHSHLMVSANFYGDGETSGDWQRPNQLIVGNGGVNLDPALDASPCSIDIDGLPATVEWGGAWQGYLYAVRRGPIEETNEQSGWELHRMRVSGAFADPTSEFEVCTSPGT